MKTLTLLFALASIALAQPTNVEITGATSTSLVVRYTAPSSAACTLVASSSSSLTPVVNDLNTALGRSASDSRAVTGAGVAGPRVVVIGDLGSFLYAGRVYSLPLQADAQHWVSVTCGSSGTVTGRTKPVFGTAPTPVPFLAGAHGNVGMPDFDMSDRTKPAIDPSTGAAIYRIFDPSDLGFKLDRTFPIALGGTGYTSLQNIISASTGTRTTTSNTNVVALPFLDVDAGAYTYGGWANGTWNNMSSIAIRVFGKGDNATAANRQIEFCLSLDGQTCYTAKQTATLPLTTAAEVTLSDYHPEWPTGGFAGWSKQIGRDQRSTAGYVTAAASTTVTLVGGTEGFGDTGLTGATSSTARFQPDWVAGMPIYIAGSGCPSSYCTFATYIDRNHITINETITVTAAYYRSAGWSLLVNKVTGTGTIEYALGYKVAAYKALHQGQRESCSPVALPDGGRLCVFSTDTDAAGRLYYVNPATHVTRPISSLARPASCTGCAAGDIPDGTGYISPSSPSGGATFDSSDPTVLYILSSTVSGKQAIFRVACSDYTATPASLPWSYTLAGVTTHTDPCVWTVLTKPSTNLDPRTQLQVAWDESKYGALTGLVFESVTNGHAILSKLMTAGDLPCGVFSFDITSGLYERSINTLNGVAGARFFGCHAITTAAGEVTISYNELADANSNFFGGPFTSTPTCVYKSGTCNANTSLPAGSDGSYDSTCPVDLDAAWIALGATGTRCVKLRISGQPCSATAGSSEKAAHVCPSDAAKSYIGANLAPGDSSWETGDGELMTLVKVTDVGGGLLELVLMRDSATGYFCRSAAALGRQCEGSEPQAQHANGWVMKWRSRSNLLIWNAGTGAVTHDNDYLSRLHFHRTNPGQYIGSQGFGDKYFSRSGNVGGPADSVFARPPVFAGVGPSTSVIQSYIAGQSHSASGVAAKLISDWPHFNGSSGIGPEAPGQTLGSTMTFTLQGGTTSVYKVSPISGGTYDPKRGELAVWAGSMQLGEKSSPTTASHTLTDSDVGRWCHAFRNGECRTGSTAGDLYVVVPFLETSLTTCQASQMSYRSLCVFVAGTVAGNVVQTLPANDTTGSGSRVLSRSSTRNGGQYVYSSAKPAADSAQVLASAYHVGGWFTTPVLIDGGRWPDVSRNGGEWAPVKVQYNAASWYVEFGYGPSLYCRPNRAEVCKVAAATIGATPYYFAADSMTAAAGDVQVTIPALPNRTLYYRIVAAGVTGPTQVITP